MYLSLVARAAVGAIAIFAIVLVTVDARPIDSGIDRPLVVAQASPSPSPSPSPAPTGPTPRAGGFPLELAGTLTVGGLAAVATGALVLWRNRRRSG